MALLSTSGITSISASENNTNSSSDVNTNTLNINSNSNNVYKENGGANVRVINSNDQWKEAQQELISLNKQNLTPEEKSDKVKDIMAKYDGAEADLNITPNSSIYANKGPQINLPANVKEKFIDGGVNDYAYTKSGLQGLRSYYSTMSAELVVSGGAAGALSGPVGFLVGVIGGTLFASRAGDAVSDVKDLIKSNKSKGGCRITAIEEFTIPYLTAKHQG